jgi:farnesyl diphosphate synthase/geranylgeranyl diphosphate synthase type II
LKTSTAEPDVAVCLAAARARVDAVLEAWGAGAGALWPAPVAAAMRYSLLSAGKRLRPALVFAAYEAAGGAAEAAGVAELAAALEVVHAYSLVHDDLPAMDNDEVRRGRPTTHRAFDVGTATRAGYQMVALAARGLAAAMATLGLPPERQRTVALELFRAAGAGGMIGGQALDLAAEGRAVARAALAESHRRKTGALIAAACAIGGLAAGAPPAGCAALRRAGAELGLAFQIHDDILDATGTAAQLGKAVGRDAARAKATFVTLLGVAGARAEAERRAARAVDALREAGLASATLTALARYIVTRQT